MIRTLIPATRQGKAALAVLVLGVLGVVYVGATMLRGGASAAGSSSTGDSRDRESGFDVAVPSARRVAGFVESYAPRVEETERDVRKLEDELKASGKREKEREALLRQLLDRMEERDRKEAVDRESAGLPSPAALPGEKAFLNAALLGPDGARKGEPAKEPDVAARIQRIAVSSPPSAQKKETHIPAGSFAEGVMLTGVFAPVEGQAMPVQIRLTSDWTTPNRGRVPLGDAFVVGKAQGDANSERAIVQLEKLSYVHTTGRTIEVGVNGYIADKDGIQGAGGKYVWRAQELLLYSAFAGGAQGAGDALSQSQTSTQVNPLGGAAQILTGDVGKFAGGRALSGAASQMNQSIAKRLNEISPAIWVPNGRRVTVILIDGATFPNLDPKEIDRGDSHAPFSGLDLDR
jgi:hypothetical protein